MSIQVARDEADKKPKILCPKCRQIIIVSAVAYEQDATKPILSNCPYCGAGIFSCILILASTELKHLQTLINQAVSAIGPSVTNQNKIIGGQRVGEPS
jgi:hypothetical protein